MTPEAITAARPPVVTITGHGLSNGQLVRATKFVVFPLAVATGMEQLNNNLYMIQNVTADTFELYTTRGLPLDGTNYTAYVSGGQFTLTGPGLLIVNPSEFPT